MGAIKIRREFGSHFRIASFFAAHLTGNAIVLVFGISATLAWAGVGMFAGFSSQWLAISSAFFTVGTLLLLILLRHAEVHNRKAVQAKLDALIHSSQAGNHLIASETLPEAVLEDVRRRHHVRAHGEA
jgi:low affinity Fe/Cu permease